MIKQNILYFCKTPELIENYEKATADKTQVWECHHRLETHTSDGERRLVNLSKQELIALNMYHNRPPEELILLTKKEHVSLHKKERALSKEHKTKISVARKGQHLSEESIAKRTTARKDYHWFTDGIKNVLRKDCPNGFRAGRVY